MTWPPGGRRECMYAAVFQSVVLLSFGVSILAAGVFTAYFGAGKSRRIGLALTLLGILSVILFTALTWDYVPALAGAAQWDPAEVLKGVVAVLGAVVGSLVALVLFLLSIMRA